jgi:hypothetical protein
VSVGVGGGGVSASEVVGSLSELVVAASSVVVLSVSVEVEEPVVVSSVTVLALAASTGRPSSACAAKAPPSAAPRANSMVATNRSAIDRARIAPFSRSRGFREERGGATRGSAEG